MVMLHIFLFFRLRARVEVLGEEFVFVVAQVGCVDDLVEVVCGLLLLFKWFCSCAIVSEVVSGAVGRVDHESCFEEFFFVVEVRCESPYVWRVSVVKVELKPFGGPFSNDPASRVVVYRVVVVRAAHLAEVSFVTHSTCGGPSPVDGVPAGKSDSRGDV